jgi:hypothetical protein
MYASLLLPSVRRKLLSSLNLLIQKLKKHRRIKDPCQCEEENPEDEIAE